MGYYRYLKMDFSDFVYDFSDRITFSPEHFLLNYFSKKKNNLDMLQKLILEAVMALSVFLK